ncbi:hypothetical protein M3Y96_01236200 [Aphelenchoides besseyi]|nr:hypothetical protein M3Y96_01236200 [Aphelenchoides besseyi]
MKLWARYCLALVFGILTITLILHYYSLSHGQLKVEKTAEQGFYLESTAIQFLDERLVREFERDQLNGPKKKDYRKCSMSTCFNYTKCLWKPFRVYVYPTAIDLPMSSVYEKILRAIRDSFYYTEKPEEACLFVLSLDTADRDWRSARIQSLPSDLWNNGRNHLIFNLYYGTYPNYSPKDIGFDPQNAIMAWASAGSTIFRDGFDISFPLFHAEHPLRRAPQKPVAKNPWEDRHLVSFKGKRYVYGIGSTTRDSLYHLHNNQSTIIATTCRHNTDWKKFEDSRCSKDNRDYNYADLLENSSFCLTPRGRRLGSFRFLEALKSGCIPTTDWLANIPTERIARMKRAAQVIYHRHFSSVEKIVLSTIEIVAKRVQFADQSTDHLFNSRTQTPKFTAIIQATKRFSSRLNKMIIGATELKEVDKFIVLWPKSRGQPPESTAFNSLRQSVEFVQVNEMDQRNLFNLDESRFPIDSNFVITLDERIRFNITELRLLIKHSVKQPNRLITYHALSHQLGDLISPSNENSTTSTTIETKVAANLLNVRAFQVVPPLRAANSTQRNARFNFSIGLLHFAAFSRHLLCDYTATSAVATALKLTASLIPQCPVVLFNSFLADRTLQPPILIGNGQLPAFALQNRAHLKMVAATAKKTDRKSKNALNKLVTREYTIHIHKYIHNIGFKYRAPRAIKEIRKFAEKQMGTPDVRIDTRVNKYIWSKGVRNVPYRIRVRLSRRRNEDEDSQHKLYTLVTFVPVTNFKKLTTVNVDQED